MWDLTVDYWDTTPGTPPLKRKVLMFVEDEMLVGRVVALVTDPLTHKMTIEREPHGQG